MSLHGWLKVRSFLFNSLLKGRDDSLHSTYDLTFIILFCFCLPGKAISRRRKVLILFIIIYVFLCLVFFIKQILFFHFQKWIRHSYNFALKVICTRLPKRTLCYKSCQNELEGECGIYSLRTNRLYGAKFVLMEMSSTC